jgi:hypothetical protein
VNADGKLFDRRLLAATPLVAYASCARLPRATSSRSASSRPLPFRHDNRGAAAPAAPLYLDRALEGPARRLTDDPARTILQLRI